MTPEEYGRSFDARIEELIGDAAARIEPLAARCEAAGLVPGEIVDLDTLDRIEILTKDALLALQRDDPPFGGMLDPEAPVRRYFQSPGPLYEPELDRPDPWRWGPALTAAGFGPDDIVLNGFGYHLSPAGAMFEEGARAVGAVVVPGGVGNTELQIQACVDLGVTAFIGLPSYLKALLEKSDDAGSPVGIQKAFVTAEPLPPSLRSWLEERVPVVRQGYGTAEAGNLGYECSEAEGFHVPSDALVEVCDLDTGLPLWDGSEGKVVVTLFDPEYPLVRFGTGDLSRYITERCPCGRPTPRLAGWLGRVGDAVKVRGMFLHPAQAVRALQGIPGLAAFRFVIERHEHKDELRCEVVSGEGEDVAELVSRVAERIRSALRFRSEVAPVDHLDEGPVIEDRRTWE
jgi:phenylacetate-CoA ligase